METWLPIAIVRYFLLMGGPTKRAMAADDAARSCHSLEVDIPNRDGI